MSSRKRENTNQIFFNVDSAMMDSPKKKLFLLILVDFVVVSLDFRNETMASIESGTPKEKKI